MAARVALLLHMHQPDYRDPRTGVPVMPWVRMHAVRGYLDVAAAALEHGAELTVNVVPSLLEQLQWYADGGSDPWLDMARIPAEDLDAAQAAFVSRRFVTGHPAMRAGAPRYQQLAAKAATHGLTTARELRDLAVWSNLAWFGFTAGQDPLVVALREQDRDFTHDQLVALLDLQARCSGRVLELWRQLPSVSCSPATHPILPLLVDFSHARRSLPDLPSDLDGVRFAWPEDAVRQLEEGRSRTAAVLGRAPAGLWPSEGAIGPEVAELAHAAGYAWAATDQGVLERSLRDGAPDHRGPWEHSSGLRLLFRDRELSDRVSFAYQHWEGEKAAEDLLARASEGRVVPVILDGENPWEAFVDAGEAFIRRLFGSGRLCTLDDAARLEPQGRIHRLHTGSWIDSDVRIWAGDHEDRAAWRLLAEAREAWSAAGEPEAGWRHLAAAEGSDWFWWFGPEFQTPTADLFDELFRAHLQAVWRACGRTPPVSLAHPVKPLIRAHAPRPVVPPISPDPPEEDDWAGATPLVLDRGGAMARAEMPVVGGAIGIGEDPEATGHALISVRLDLPTPRLEPPPGSRLRLVLRDIGALEFGWAGVHGGPVTLPLLPADGAVDPRAQAQGARVAVGVAHICVRVPVQGQPHQVAWQVERLRARGVDRVPLTAPGVVQLPAL